MAKWLLLDGFNLAYRSFHSISDMSRADGFPTNAIHGFVRTVWYLEDTEKPNNIVVFFDLGGSLERLAILPSYKAHRSEMPEPLQLQIPFIKDLTRALGYSLIEEQGVEADDLVASTAFQLLEKGHEVIIVSSDKDFAQLLRPGLTQLLPPPTANPKVGWRKVTHETIPERFGVHPDQIVDYLSLIGDSADNIPGVLGVGPKTAVKWMNEYGSIDKLMAKVNYVEPARFQVLLPQYKNQLQLNQEMIRLQTHLKIGPLADKNPQPQQLIALLKSMEMKKATADAQKRYKI